MAAPSAVTANIEGQASISHIEKLLNDHRKSIQEARRLDQTIASKSSAQKQSVNKPASKPLSQSLDRGVRSQSSEKGTRGGTQDKSRTSQSLDRHTKRNSATETSSPSSFKTSTPRRISTTILDKSMRDPSKKATATKSSVKTRSSRSLNRTGSNNNEMSPSPSPSRKRVGRSGSTKRSKDSGKVKPLKLTDFLSGSENLNSALERLGWKPAGRANPRANEIFELMDLKSDGRIDLQELKIGLTRLRRGWIEDSELSILFEQYDPESTGFIGPLAFSDFVKGGGLSSSNSTSERSSSRRSSTARSTSPRITPMHQSIDGEAQKKKHNLLSSDSSSRPPVQADPLAKGSYKESSTIESIRPTSHTKIAKILYHRQSSGEIESTWPGDYTPKIDDVCYGVRRTYWDDVGFRHGISGGVGIGETSFFATSDLSHVIRGLKCGLRVDANFARLLSIKLDPGHTGRIRFTVLERWLRNSMGLLASLSDGLAPKMANEPLEARAKRQIKALDTALAVTPSLDHVLIDMTVLTLARLRLHAPPHTPLHGELTNVLSQRGFLPSSFPNSNRGFNGEVEDVLQRYTEDDGDFIPSTGLTQLLSDLDFYFPDLGVAGIDGNELTKKAFLSKLDIFGEGQAGVNISVLRLWWRDLEVVVGAVDSALTDLETCLNIPDTPSAEDQLVDTEREIHGDVTPLFDTSTFAIGRAAAALVVSIHRANAAIAPLGHHMVDEALTTLHRSAQERVMCQIQSKDRKKTDPLDIDTGLLPLFICREKGQEELVPGPHCHASLGVGCLVGLHCCSSLVENLFGGQVECFENPEDTLETLLRGVGFPPSDRSQLSELAKTLESGDGTLSFDQVIQSLTGARLKLERLQVSLLHAVGSVASRMDGVVQSSTNMQPSDFIDDATFHRLQNVSKPLKEDEKPSSPFYV